MLSTAKIIKCQWEEESNKRMKHWWNDTNILGRNTCNCFLHQFLTGIFKNVVHMLLQINCVINECRGNKIYKHTDYKTSISHTILTMKHIFQHYISP